MTIYIVDDHDAFRSQLRALLEADGFAVIGEASSGAKAIAVPGDVASEDDVARLFAETDRALGRVSVLVNNAGIVDRSQRVEQITAARLARMFAVNVTGSFLCAREAVKRMSTKHGGGVVCGVFGKKMRPTAYCGGMA